MGQSSSYKIPESDVEPCPNMFALTWDDWVLSCDPDSPIRAGDKVVICSDPQDEPEPGREKWLFGICTRTQRWSFNIRLRDKIERIKKRGDVRFARVISTFRVNDEVT